MFRPRNAHHQNPETTPKPQKDDRTESWNSLSCCIVKDSFEQNGLRGALHLPIVAQSVVHGECTACIYKKLCLQYLLIHNIVMIQQAWDCRGWIDTDITARNEWPTTRTISPTIRGEEGLDPQHTFVYLTYSQYSGRGRTKYRGEYVFFFKCICR